MAEKKIKYLKNSNNQDFIEIYEDEIKRLIQKNDDLRVEAERSNSETSLLQQALGEANKRITLLSDIEQQNTLLKEKIVSVSTSLINEKDQAVHQLNIEKKKVESLQRKIEEVSTKIEVNKNLPENSTKIVELTNTNELLKRQLIEEKAELAEIMLDARKQSKTIVEEALKNAEEMKEAANQEVIAKQEKIKKMNSRLEKIKNESDKFISMIRSEFGEIIE